MNAVALGSLSRGVDWDRDILLLAFPTITKMESIQGPSLTLALSPGFSCVYTCPCGQGNLAKANNPDPTDSRLCSNNRRETRWVLPGPFVSSEHWNCKEA